MANGSIKKFDREPTSRLFRRAAERLTFVITKDRKETKQVRTQTKRNLTERFVNGFFNRPRKLTKFCGSSMITEQICLDICHGKTWCNWFLLESNVTATPTAVDLAEETDGLKRRLFPNISANFRVSLLKKVGSWANP